MAERGEVEVHVAEDKCCLLFGHAGQRHRGSLSIGCELPRPHDKARGKTGCFKHRVSFIHHRPLLGRVHVS